jgi:large exoprotein involved in heme utilization and adhesion
VTGGNISQILGTLGVLGNANLYFLNPNGILFGPTARLDIKGAFFATTADSFQFPNNYAFSSSNPTAPPLLTVNIPIGLNFRANAREIQIQTGETGSLKVEPGQHLILAGGLITSEGGQILSPGSNLSLLSIQGEGQVVLEPDLSFQIPETLVRGDILLNNNFKIDVSSVDKNLNGGNITIIGNNITLGDLLSNVEITGNSDISGVSGGTILLNARGHILTQNINSSSSLGNGGSITLTAGEDISTHDLLAYSSSQTGNAGNGGSISLLSSGDILTGVLYSYSESKSPSGIARNGGNISLYSGGNISTYLLNKSLPYGLSNSSSY